MSCDNRINDRVFEPELISEIGQEVLGDQIFAALISDASPYNVLQREEHAALYQFLEQLYTQSILCCAEATVGQIAEIGK